MSWKSIELQVALPRTFEANKVQEQHQQRSQIDQSQTAVAQAKEAEHSRKSVDKQEQKEKAHLSGDQKGSNPHFQQKDQEKKQSGKHNSDHPFKGKHIDFSG